MDKSENINIKEYCQNLKNDLIEIEELDDEIVDLEKANEELDYKYETSMKFFNIKNGFKSLLLYMATFVFVVTMINIDFILIALLIASCILTPSGLIFKGAYNRVKKINSKTPCFGKDSTEQLMFLKSKCDSLHNRIDRKKKRKEELCSKLSSYTENGKFSPTFYNILFKKVDELDNFFQKNFNDTLHEDVSNIHFNSSIDDEIDYTEKTKKLFKKM